MTPHRLQVSGIGPANVLRAASIAVKKDLPGLGANYQDHATTMTRYTLSNQSFLNPDTIFPNATYNATVWDEYLANKIGPIAAASANTLLLLSFPQPSPLSAASSLFVRLLGNGFLPGWLLKPLSRGTVYLNASNPRGLPIVQFNTLLNPLDDENIATIVRYGRRFFASPEFGPLGQMKVVPGTQYTNDREILDVLTGWMRVCSRLFRGVRWRLPSMRLLRRRRMLSRLGGREAANAMHSVNSYSSMQLRGTQV